VADQTELTAEINELLRLQIKAVKDATFIGWDAAERAAYEERTQRLALLRRQRFELGGLLLALVCHFAVVFRICIDHHLDTRVPQSSGTVERIKKFPVPSEPEKAQITVEGGTSPV
jgi:hypothetical protein